MMSTHSAHEYEGPSGLSGHSEYNDVKIKKNRGGTQFSMQDFASTTVYTSAAKLLQ